VKTPPAKEGRGRQVDRKPGSDYPATRANDDWERDRRVRLPHDHLVKAFAITLTEFKAMTS
jgi:hypothetical protein